MPVSEALSASRLLRAGDPLSRPSLLVSVSSEVEALTAIAAGVDIVDIKDPSRGSLGCARLEMVTAIAAAADISPPKHPVLTVALGECTEWRERAAWAIPPRIQLAKLGLAGLRHTAGWRKEWLALRCRFDAARTEPLEWVAVAYVDDLAADSPAIADIAEAAVETGCRGLLLDTYDKSSGRLLSHVSENDLTMLAHQMHAAGLFLAAAGRLRVVDLRLLAALPIDVLAVRSAACVEDDRRAGICADRIEACRAAFRV